MHAGVLGSQWRCYLFLGLCSEEPSLEPVAVAGTRFGNQHKIRSPWLREVLGDSLAEEGLIELPVSPQPVQQDGQLPRYRHHRPFLGIFAAAGCHG